jgi:superfamily II DNA or RNA helicase
VIKSGIEPEIQGLIYKIGDVVKLSDCIDMPDQIFEIENIELSKEQKKEIERIKQEEINPIVKYTKIHQAENGILIGDEYNPDKFFDNLKLERIAEYCEEKDKVVIFCRYNLQLKQIKEYLNKKFYALKIITINGKTKDRHLLIEIAELPQVKRCVCIINAACAEGYELPSFGTVIYASMSFSYVHNKQSQGRVMRINKPKKNLYVYLISGDLDKAVYKSFQAKKDFDVLEYSNEIRSGISDKIQPMVQEQG